jgi:uncharacterized protein (DUF58 family)
MLLAIWAGVAALAAFWEPALRYWSGAGVGVALVLALDALSIWHKGPLEVEREVPGSLALGAWTRALLRVHNRGRSMLRAEATDHQPQSMRVRGLPRSVAVAPGEHAEIPYSLLPEARGDLGFERPELRVRSRLGLWRRRLRAGQGERVRVFPNFRELMKYSLLATEHRTSALGIRQRPRRGDGLDFHELREYRTGDSLRQIDWKATARQQKTISREYQQERDQQILFLLDCGRKMHARDDALSHFDHALNALLLLAHVALRHGDAVGLLTFSGEHRWLAPAKGGTQLNAMLRALYDLETTTRASDYVRAAQDLTTRVRKRALVVLVSNLRDEDHDELTLATRLLLRRHLVLVASMRERVLEQALEEPVRDTDDAVRVAATHQYLESRRLAHERLRRSGVLSLDALPDALAVALVNGYLDIKRASLL